MSADHSFVILVIFSIRSSLIKPVLVYVADVVDIYALIPPPVMPSRRLLKNNADPFTCRNAHVVRKMVDGGVDFGNWIGVGAGCP